MHQFSHSIARIAVWNLAGNNIFNPDVGIEPDSDRAERQAEGLALLDAELVTLVEVSPANHIDVLAQKLQGFGLDYQTKILPQANGNIHIGFLHKPGIEVENLAFIPGSEGTSPSGRQALVADIKVGGLKAKVIGVHLKSGSFS